MKIMVNDVKPENIPINSYYVPEVRSDDENHMIEKRPTTGARMIADKLVKDVYCYAPKGLKGSKNSNFYEFLSLGLIPNIVGSAMLILISNALNNINHGRDSIFASMNGKKMGAGVVLFAVGKWLGGKLLNKAVDLRTGMEIDSKVKYIVPQLPEYKGEEVKPSVEFHDVFESVDFPGFDKINKRGEAKNDRYGYYDKVAEKMGYKKKLNASDQYVQPVLREVLVKTKAAKAISQYIWAALGVAIASQDSFGEFMSHSKKLGIEGTLKVLPREICKAMGGSIKSLAKTKMGKGLMIGAVASTVLGALNATKNFKAEKPEKKSTVDYTKKYTEL